MKELKEKQEEILQEEQENQEELTLSEEELDQVSGGGAVLRPLEKEPPKRVYS